VSAAHGWGPYGHIWVFPLSTFGRVGRNPRGALIRPRSGFAIRTVFSRGEEKSCRRGPKSDMASVAYLEGSLSARKGRDESRIIVGIQLDTLAILRAIVGADPSSAPGRN
jgi:hypothetical protein